VEQNETFKKKKVSTFKTPSISFLSSISTPYICQIIYGWSRFALNNNDITTSEFAGCKRFRQIECTYKNRTHFLQIVKERKKEKKNFSSQKKKKKECRMSELTSKSIMSSSITIVAISWSNSKGVCDRLGTPSERESLCSFAESVSDEDVD
jgi:hypothetical protein